MRLSLFDAHTQTAPPPAEPPPDVPLSLDLDIRTFLNRWLFNWRGERAVVERELRALVDRARQG